MRFLLDFKPQALEKIIFLSPVLKNMATFIQSDFSVLFLLDVLISITSTYCRYLTEQCFVKKQHN